MELRQIKYFLAVARTGSFSEASRRLYVSQSTLSQQIMQLEDELGSPLFLRTSRNVVPTEAGSELIPLAEKVLQGVENCSVRIKDLKKVLCGTLNIGVTHSFSALMAGTIRDFMTGYPGVKLNVFYEPMDELTEMLLNRKIDFAMAFTPSIPNEALEIEELFEVPLSIIMRKDHPLAEKQTLTVRDLRSFGLVLPAKGMQSRKALDRLMDINTLKVRAEINAPIIILDIVANTDTLTIVSEVALETRGGLTARPLEGLERNMMGSILTLKDSYEKQSAKAFLEMLRLSAKIMRLR